jgi:hypothetical protein
LRNNNQKINTKTVACFSPPQKPPQIHHVSPCNHHKFTSRKTQKNPQPPSKNAPSTIADTQIKKTHPARFHPGFPQAIPHLRRLYSKSMSTSTISVDEFQALEQKVLRAVEIVKREREARAAAEAEVASLREQLASYETNTRAIESELTTLNKERDAVRLRVEKMLQQMDELL